MAGLDILGMLGPEIMENMIQSIQEQDTPKMQKLQVCRTTLVNLTTQLTQLNTRQTLFNNKYANYFASMSDMLSTEAAQAIGNLQQQSVAATQNAELEQIMVQLLQVEHEIMELLDPNTATHTYAIYYDIDGADGGTLSRGEIKAEDLYNSGALKLTGEKISLSRSDALQAINQYGTSTHFTKDSDGGKKYGEIAKQAIQDMHDVLDRLEREYGQVQQDMRRQHLGAQMWHRYCKLQNLFKYESNVRSLYDRYTLSAVRGWSLRGMDYNRGQLVEAFERWFQGDAGSNAKLLEESSDNLPWFAGGDVNDVQVKALFSSTSQYEAQVKVASVSSILALANELVQLLVTPEEWLKRAREAIQIALETGENSGSTNIMERLEKKIVELLQAQMSG